MVWNSVTGTIKALFLLDETPLVRDGHPAVCTGNPRRQHEPVKRLTLQVFIANLGCLHAEVRQVVKT